MRKRKVRAQLRGGRSRKEGYAKPVNRLTPAITAERRNASVCKPSKDDGELLGDGRPGRVR